MALCSHFNSLTVEWDTGTRYSWSLTVPDGQCPTGDCDGGDAIDGDSGLSVIAVTEEIDRLRMWIV